MRGHVWPTTTQSARLPECRAWHRLGAPAARLPRLVALCRRYLPNNEFFTLGEELLCNALLASCLSLKPRSFRTEQPL